MYNLLFCSEATRLGSFENWNYSDENVSTLALAGFYYSEILNRCICFECGLRITSIEEMDYPWVEHYRRSPHCKFLTGESNNNSPLDSSLLELLIFTRQNGDEIRRRIARRNQSTADSDETGIFNNLFDRTDDDITNFIFPNQNIPNEENVTSNQTNNDNRLLCKICLLREIETLFLPCRHLSVCKICAANISTCSICRSVIGWKINVFIS